jgi:putative ABC transport system ATP-binding protein
MSYIEVRNLKKTYGKGKNAVLALNNVSFTVENGEFVSVVGKSGCGKTTLMNALALIDDIDEGELYFDGVQMTGRKQKDDYRRLNIGVVFQFFNLVPVLNVEENISLPYLIQGKKVPKDLLELTLQELGLIKIRKTLPNFLSGGEQQRTAIGRAIIAKPKLLIADEPTGNLDNENTMKVLRILKNFNEKYGQTIIVVTHDTQVADFASRKISMSDGSIL